MWRRFILPVSFLLALGACVSDDGYNVVYSEVRGIPYEQDFGVEAYYTMNENAASPLFAGYADGPISIRLAHYDWNTYIILGRWGDPIGYAVYETRETIRVVDLYGNVTNYLLWIEGDEYQIIGRDGYVVGYIRLGDGGHYSIRYRQRDLGYIYGPEFGFYYTNNRYDRHHYRRFDYFGGRAALRAQRDQRRGRNSGDETRRGDGDGDGDRQRTDMPNRPRQGEARSRNARSSEVPERIEEPEFVDPPQFRPRFNQPRRGDFRRDNGSTRPAVRTTQPGQPRQQPHVMQPRQQRPQADSPRRRSDSEPPRQQRPQADAPRRAPPEARPTPRRPQQARPQPQRRPDQPIRRERPNNPREEEESEEDPPLVAAL